MAKLTNDSFSTKALNYLEVFNPFNNDYIVVGSYIAKIDPNIKAPAHV